MKQKFNPREWISIQIAKNPRGMILLAILLLNVIFIFVGAVVISHLAPESLEYDGALPVRTLGSGEVGETQTGDQFGAAQSPGQTTGKGRLAGTQITPVGQNCAGGQHLRQCRTYRFRLLGGIC